MDKKYRMLPFPLDTGLWYAIVLRAHNYEFAQCLLSRNRKKRDAGHENEVGGTSLKCSCTPHFARCRRIAVVAHKSENGYTNQF